ncbi:hypothetical protein G3I56_23190 [Streptomyces sp. SID12488]|nr:hypothetical protein [Streptomyces sp. SID12488]
MLLDTASTFPACVPVMSRLIVGTPALCARSKEKQAGRRPVIAAALAERAGLSSPTGPVPLVRGAAAVDALNIESTFGPPPTVTRTSMPSSSRSSRPSRFPRYERRR